MLIINGNIRAANTTVIITAFSFFADFFVMAGLVETLKVEDQSS